MELLKSELGDLMPVTFLNTKPEGTTQPSPSPLILTPEGRGSLLTMLADTESENEEVWRNLPGFNWYAPVERPKAGSTVLAVHAADKNAYGRIPLIVTQSCGNGKVLFMGTDSAWRWRRGVEDKYHYRFWSQVARWMSYQRNMAAGERIRLIPTPERPRPGDTLTVTAMVSDKLGAPLQNGEVFWTLRLRKEAPAAFKWTLWTIHGAPLPPPSNQPSRHLEAHCFILCGTG